MLFLGVAMRAGLHKAHTTRAGPSHSAYFMRAENIDMSYILSGPQARGPVRFFFFKKKFMIKLSMFKNWETLRSSQN